MQSIVTTQVHRVHGTPPARFPILSVCPTCKLNQAQWYTRAALFRLLNGDLPVEGYCATCDEFWSISARERTGLAMALRWTRAAPNPARVRVPGMRQQLPSEGVLKRQPVLDGS